MSRAGPEPPGRSSEENGCRWKTVKSHERKRVNGLFILAFHQTSDDRSIQIIQLPTAQSKNTPLQVKVQHLKSHLITNT